MQAQRLLSQGTPHPPHPPHRTHVGRPSPPSRLICHAQMASTVDQALNPLVASVKPSKTMALTDMATQMKEQGIDVRGAAC